MITIKNTQKTVSLDIPAIKKDVQKILDALDYQDYDIGIWFTSDATIAKYNKKYRNQDKATDVLSFSFHPHLKAGNRIKPRSEEDKNLGDLIVAPSYVQKDLPKWNATFEDHLKRLLVHGICHLLGYDHIQEDDYKIMHKKEMALLKKL